MLTSALRRSGSETDDVEINDHRMVETGEEAGLGSRQGFYSGFFCASSCGLARASIPEDTIRER